MIDIKKRIKELNELNPKKTPELRIELKEMYLELREQEENGANVATVKEQLNKLCIKLLNRKTYERAKKKRRRV